MKLGFIIDSASGLTQVEARERGFGFLPLLFAIDGKEYKDGIDIDAQKFYEIIDIDQEVRTSATPPALIMEEYAKMAKAYDHVIVYGISHELSSQNNNLTIFAREFNNIHVVHSLGVGHKIIHDIEKMAAEAKKGMAIEKVVELGNMLSLEQYGIALPATMKWLVKGGRISPAVASLAKLFRIVPMIAYDKGRLEKYGKGKHFLNTIEEATNHLVKTCGKENDFYIYHGASPEIKEVQTIVERIIGKKAIINYCPPVIAIHIGPGVIGIMTSRK